MCCDKMFSYTCSTASKDEGNGSPLQKAAIVAAESCRSQRDRFAQMTTGCAKVAYVYRVFALAVEWYTIMTWGWGLQNKPFKKKETINPRSLWLPTCQARDDAEDQGAVNLPRSRPLMVTKAKSMAHMDKVADDVDEPDGFVRQQKCKCASYRAQLSEKALRPVSLQSWALSVFLNFFNNKNDFLQFLSS